MRNYEKQKPLSSATLQNNFRWLFFSPYREFNQNTYLIKL